VRLVQPGSQCDAAEAGRLVCGIRDLFVRGRVADLARNGCSDCGSEDVRRPTTTSYFGVNTQQDQRHSRLDGLDVASLLVACAVLVQTLVMGRAIVVLDVALVISLVVWGAYRRRLAPAPRVLPAFTVALLVQIAHFFEEYYTGFHRSFPALFGYVWEDGRFVAFNVAWVAILAVSAFAILRGYRLGYLGGFFLAIGAGIGNGFGHLALAARAGGYFPGSYTAVLSFGVGSVLLAQLIRSPDSARQRDWEW
jgi:hypothetical protein